ncbi:hypothetical protein HYDPIDRAFT_111700 [Hydnomerulius pinastri MD-312]|uniref:Uncharacterized protein n=1 Tax=Hydnomerulius pinastri MD-312 TaxID=994086 RepID=A0A0C9VH78_9AGAM|nr:hypothetical protein HYDPIDRAFT_111700 [Hydnomerulius pinastri MD-312]
MAPRRGAPAPRTQVPESENGNPQDREQPEAHQQSTSRNVLQDKVNEQAQELLALKTLLEKEISARQMAEQAAMTNGGPNSSMHGTTIEKPKGQAGEKGFNLMAEMMLEDDKPSYLAILRDVRDLCHAAQLDWTIDYRHQPPKDIGNIFDVAKKRHPYLVRFRHNWATSEIIKQFLRNRRKHTARKSRSVSESSGGANASSPGPSRAAVGGRGRHAQSSRSNNSRTPVS